MSEVAEVLDGLDRQAEEVASRLAGLAAVVPASSALASSLGSDLARHASERRALRRRLRLTPGAPLAVAEAPSSIDALRAAQEALLLAHADGLPRLGDRHAVDVVAHHMVDAARHLAVTDLWIDAERDRG